MIVLGASHDNGYANILSSLSTENRLSKLLLLKGYTDLAGQLRQYGSRVVTIPDLFRTSKIPVSFSAVAAKEAKEKEKEKEREKPKSAVPGAPPGKKAAASNPTPEGAATKAKAAKAAAAASKLAAATANAAAVAAAVGKKVKDDKSVGGKGVKARIDDHDERASDHNDSDDDDMDHEGVSDDRDEIMSAGSATTADVIEWSSVWTTVPKGKPKPVTAAAAAATGAGAAIKGKGKDGYKKDKKGTEYFKDKVGKRKGWAVRELDPRPCHTYVSPFISSHFTPSVA